MSPKDSHSLDTKSRKTPLFKGITENRPTIACANGRVLLSNWLPFIADFGHHRQVREEYRIRGEPVMDFYDVVGHVLELLQRQKRVSYRALKRQLSIDNDDIEDLKEEIIEAQRLGVDENGRILVWIGNQKHNQQPFPHRQRLSPSLLQRLSTSGNPFPTHPNTSPKRF